MKNGRKIFDTITKSCSVLMLLIGISYFAITIIALSMVIPSYGDDGANAIIAAVIIFWGLVAVALSFTKKTEAAAVIILGTLIILGINYGNKYEIIPNLW